MKKHKVRSGESLSVLAQRYKISVARIKAVNNLKSNVLRIGQTLKIPRAGIALYRESPVSNHLKQ